MSATCSPSQSIVPISCSSADVHDDAADQQHGRPRDLARPRPWCACGDSSDSTAAIESATKPTSKSNASATTTSATMPISVRIGRGRAPAPPRRGGRRAAGDRRAARSRGLLALLALEAPGARSSGSPTRRGAAAARARRTGRTRRRSAAKLKTNDEKNSSVGFPSRSLSSTTPLTIEPKTLIGEKPPAVAPLTTHQAHQHRVDPVADGEPERDRRDDRDRGRDDRARRGQHRGDEEHHPRDRRPRGRRPPAPPRGRASPRCRCSWRSRTGR